MSSRYSEASREDKQHFWIPLLNETSTEEVTRRITSRAESLAYSEYAQELKRLLDDIQWKHQQNNGIFQGGYTESAMLSHKAQKEIIDRQEETEKAKIVAKNNNNVQNFVKIITDSYNKQKESMKKSKDEVFERKVRFEMMRIKAEMERKRVKQEAMKRLASKK